MIPPSSASGNTRRRVTTDACTAINIALTVWTILLATSRDYGMVWDEGHTIRRERMLAEWMTWLVNPAWRTRGDAFSSRTLAQYWPFSREEPDGHPPFYAMLGLAGWWLSRNYLEPLTAYRFGPMGLFAATVGTVYFHFARRHGRLAAVTAVGLLVLMPRVFAHAHYAHYDVPMSCLWLLAQMAFVNCLRSRRWIVPFGMALGLGAATKFTGWLAPAAPIAWVVVFEIGPWLRRWWTGGATAAGETDRRAGTKAVLGGLAVALLVLYLIQPPWWSSPWRGPIRFFQSNLSRSETRPIPTLYLGTVYGFSLPWHNTLVLTAVTVPVLVVLLGALGIVATLRRSRADRESMIWFLSWAVLMIVRALPAAPGHDGVRLFLPSILSLSLLAGLGAKWLADLLRPRRLHALAAVLAGCAAGESLLGIVQLYPYTLSYYNIAVGGLAGAERDGFELTYYWDTMGPEFLDWVRQKNQPEDVELRFPSDLVNIRFLREWNALPATVRVVGLEKPRQPYYVLQRRRGVYYPYDWWLERHGTPCFTIRRQGVDLLRVYSYDESYRAFEATRAEPIPEYLRH